MTQESGEHESDKDCEVIGGKENVIANDSKVKASSVESAQKAQSTSTSCPRQGCVHQKEWRAKFICQAGHIEETFTGHIEEKNFLFTS